LGSCSTRTEKDAANTPISTDFSITGGGGGGGGQLKEAAGGKSEVKPQTPHRDPQNNARKELGLLQEHITFFLGGVQFEKTSRLPILGGSAELEIIGEIFPVPYQVYRKTKRPSEERTSYVTSAVGPHPVAPLMLIPRRGEPLPSFLREMNPQLECELTMKDAGRIG